MKTVDQQLFDFIDEQEHYELILSNGITISALDSNLLQAEFTLANMGDASLSVIFCCEQHFFVKTLGIRKIQEIYALTPERLIETYHEGLAEMACFVTIEYTYVMGFRKQGDTTIAENERGIKHNIPDYEKLETPDQFIAYAKEYYMLMECNEN
jgi:hypothetical protein